MVRPAASPSLVAVLLLVVLLGACAGPSGARAPAGWRQGTWVELVTAPGSQDLSREQVGQAMTGHFSNMDRLVEAGQLWVAGPLGEPKADPLHRGVYLLAAADVAEGLELARSDPAVQAGVFALRAASFASPDAVERIAELDRDLLAARQAARPDETVTWEGRGYVLARNPRGPVADAVVASLRAGGQALFAGHLGGDDWLVCLDVQQPPAARAALVAAGAGKTAGDWTLMPWYASAALVDLPELSR